MTPFHLAILALIQGITEFLPISSSAHLILLPLLMEWRDQGPLIDVMAHVGTLAAVLVYFRADVTQMIVGALDLVRRRMTPGARLALYLILATPPVILAGGALYVSGLVDLLRDPVLIAYMNLAFAVPLWAADHYCKATRRTEDMRFYEPVLIGLAQMCALFPGTSRSGVTMTAARALGLARDEAARFSMLMAIPVLLAFGAAAGLDLATAEAGADVSLSEGLLVAWLSFLAALAAIWVMMKIIARIGFLPFVIYRIALGLTLISAFGWTVGAA